MFGGVQKHLRCGTMYMGKDPTISMKKCLVSKLYIINMLRDLILTRNI